jgi:hypothetical protein
MKNDILDGINVRRVLDRIINDMDIANKLRPFNYDDIKGALLPETSESRITEALRIMVGEGILRVKSRLSGRPPRYLSGKDEKRAKGEQRGRKPSNYQIILNQSAFEKIFHIYLNDDIKKFLTSLYTDKMIKESGFSVVYDVIKPHLERSEFRKIASRSLLDHSSIVAEYNELGKFLRRELSGADNYQFANNSEIEKEPVEVSRYLIELGRELSTTSIKPIEILSSLDPLQAVRFYRKTLNKSILKAYNELAEKSIITEGLRDFLAFDNYSV